MFIPDGAISCKEVKAKEIVLKGAIHFLRDPRRLLGKAGLCFEG